MATILITFLALHQQGKKDAELSMRAVKHLADKVAKHDKTKLPQPQVPAAIETINKVIDSIRLG